MRQTRRRGCAMAKASNKCYAPRGGNLSIPLPAAPIAVEAFSHGRPKTRQSRSPASRSGEKFFRNVNYLTLLDRFPERCCLRIGAHLANAGLKPQKGAGNVRPITAPLMSLRYMVEGLTGSLKRGVIPNEHEHVRPLL